MRELWRPVVWRGEQIADREISDRGRLRNVQTGQLSAIQHDKHGYCYCYLNTHAGWVLALLHRVVAIAFLPPAPAGHCVTHKNFKRQDNRACNLEWISQSANLKRLYKKGRLKGHGPRTPVELRMKIKQLCGEGHSQVAVARLCGVNNATVSRIIHGRR